MSDTSIFEDEFWSAMQRLSTGMLTIRAGAVEHVAPMTAHFDERGPLFFYAPADGVLAKHIAEPHSGRWFYADPHHHLFASADGALSIDADPARRAHFWSDEVESWFPGGPQQDGVVLLRCDLGEAQVWLGTSPHGDRNAVRDRRAHVDL